MVDNSPGAAELEKLKRLKKIGGYAQGTFWIFIIVSFIFCFFLLLPNSNGRLFFAVFGPLILLFATLSIAWNTYLGIRWRQVMKAYPSQNITRPIRCEIYGIENPHYTGDVDVYVQPRQVQPRPVESDDMPPPYNEVVNTVTENKTTNDIK